MVDALCCLLGPAAILVSVFFAWRYHKTISAKRATLDFMVTAQASKDWTEGNALFGKLTASGQERELLELVNPKGQDQIENAVKIAAYLNLFELVAVAIKQNAMHEETYKQLQYTRFVKTWRNAHAFITAKRNQKSQPSMYENFEKLANDWMKNNS